MTDEHRDNQEKQEDSTGFLLELSSFPYGDYDVNPLRKKWWQFWKEKDKNLDDRGGWLSVYRDAKGLTNIMWTTDKDYHWPLGRFGKARSLLFNTDGTLLCYFESALSMHIKWGYGRGGDEEFNTAMNFARWSHDKLRRTLASRQNLDKRSYS